MKSMHRKAFVAKIFFCLLILTTGLNFSVCSLANENVFLSQEVTKKEVTKIVNFFAFLKHVYTIICPERLEQKNA